MSVVSFNNPDKGALTHAIVHRALWEYVAAVIAHPDRALSEKLYREAFDMCQDTLAEMVHTKDGSRVAREFLARGSAKEQTYHQAPEQACYPDVHRRGRAAGALHRGGCGGVSTLVFCPALRRR